MNHSTAKPPNLALLLVAVLASGCSKVEPITSEFVDTFERQNLGANYYDTGGNYRIEAGKLRVQGAYNHPLWLRRPLPRNAVIEFDVSSKSASGDIKVEAWGDGKTYATTKGAYLASSYVFILGGWGNRISALCRLDEHGNDRKERKDLRVERNRTYHFEIRREGNVVSWKVDGKPFLSYQDDAPLEGERHASFGFNNWESELYFDNLKIRPLK